MKPEDARKLLGGYATGTLTAAEQEALFAAALENQELFDALMKEEPLREVLQDPASKAQLLAALEAPAARSGWWSWRPLIGAVAMAGVALAAIAIWRTGAKENAVSVMVAEAPKVPPATRNLTIEPQSVVAPASAAPARSKPKLEATGTVETRRERAEESDAPKTEAAPLAKNAEGGGAPVNGAVPAGAVQQPAVQAQAQRQALAGPPPLFQQQSAPSVSLDAAPALNRAAAVNSFRAKEVAADQSLDTKSAPLLQWSVLRGDRELAPDTILDAGETIRLRVLSLVAGLLTIRDGDKVLVSASVEAAKPFDTPLIPFTASGPRSLRVTLVAPPAQPLTIGLTLNYAQPK
jgi:hypothetical protein